MESEAQKQNLGNFLHHHIGILGWIFQKFKFISVPLLIGKFTGD